MIKFYCIRWDLDTVIDISQYVKLQGGNATVGVVGSGLVISHPISSKMNSLGIFNKVLSQHLEVNEYSETKSTGNNYNYNTNNESKNSIDGYSQENESDKAGYVFEINLFELQFHCKGAMTSYPVATSFTSVRYPETYMRYVIT